MNSSLRPNRVPESELYAASESSNLGVACKREHHFFSFVVSLFVLSGIH
jgi:hypothetical protein